MSDEELEALVERLRMLCRNVIAQDRVDITVGKFAVGEDLATGNLSVDVVGPLMKRQSSYGPLKAGRIGRKCFMMVNREGDIMIEEKCRPLLKELNYALILDELANI